MRLGSTVKKSIRRQPRRWRNSTRCPIASLDVDTVETADAVAGQVGEERDHPVADAAEFLQQQRLERADVEENQIEILIERFINDRIVAVMEGDILITAAVFACGTGDGVAPFVGERDGAVVEIGDPQLRGFSRSAGHFQPSVGRPDHGAVIDQFLHRLPGGHVADSELLHQFRSPGQRAGKIVAMCDPPLQHLGDLDIFRSSHASASSKG